VSRVRKGFAAVGLPRQQEVSEREAGEVPGVPDVGDASDEEGSGVAGD